MLWQKTFIAFLVLFTFVYCPEVSRCFAEDHTKELFNNITYNEDLCARQEKEMQGPTIVRSRHVQVNCENLVGSDCQEGKEKIILNLFDEISITATKKRLEKRSLNAYTWFGEIADTNSSQVILVVENGTMAGNITIEGKMYQVRPVDNEIHAIYEIDQCAFPECDSPLIPEERLESQDAMPQKPQLDDGPIIDVMVIYTDDVASSSSNISTEINLAITETNESYANSGINQRLRLVHSKQVSYTESGSLSTDLKSITNKDDGILDDVHTWRDTYGADIVSFWVEDGGGSCGTGWLMTSVSSTFESYAFSTVDKDCATGYYSFGHELGHNMGATHDRINTTSQGAYSYSYGYQDPGGNWRTIMAYSNSCPGICTRIQYWSNPDVTYNGIATGVAEGQLDEADNRKTLNNTASTIASFRQSVSSGTNLTKPTNFDYSVSGCATSTSTFGSSASCTVSLSWDQATGASGYKLYYGPSSGNYTNPIDLGNVTSQSFSSIPEGTYYLALTAYDSSGNESEKSDELAATVNSSSSSIPTNFKATVSNCTSAFGSTSCTVSLSWTGVSGSSGYNLYYGPSSGNYAGRLDVGNVETITYSSILEGTYYLALTSYDSTGKESGNSDEVVLKVAFNDNSNNSGKECPSPSAK